MNFICTVTKCDFISLIYLFESILLENCDTFIQPLNDCLNPSNWNDSSQASSGVEMSINCEIDEPKSRHFPEVILVLEGFGTVPDIS